MTYGTSTHAQRLQWQWAETHAGLEDDLPLEEQHEIADEKFLHWETLTFARAADKPLGVERANAGPSATTDHGGPAHISSQPPIPTAGGAAVSPLGRSAVSSVERWMWSA